MHEKCMAITATAAEMLRLQEKGKEINKKCPTKGKDLSRRGYL